MKKEVKAILKESIFKAILITIKSLLIMCIWNHILVNLYDLVNISILESYGIILISKLLFNFNSNEIYKELFKNEKK